MNHTLLDLARWWLALRCPAGPLRDYYRVDTPPSGTPWREVEFVSVDLETTGLDAGRDEIVSIGWVPIVQGRLRLAEAGHLLMRPQSLMPDHSAILHGILDSHLAQAGEPSQVMPVFLAALKGRVPIAHNAKIERDFLSQACQKIYGHPLRVSFVDTLMLEWRAAKSESERAEKGRFRLGAAHARRGLPRYGAHNALKDALAAGELFLAQAAERSAKGRDARLEDLLV